MERLVRECRQTLGIVLLAAAIGVTGCERPPEDLAAGPRREGSRTSALTGDFQFVQVAYATPQNPVSSLAVKYAAAQTAGNLNVVAVGWNDTTAVVNTVSDTKGNVYTRAIGPTQYPGALSQSIYYAKNISGALVGANTVTVTFNTPAAYVDVRILEYAGVDPSNPVDVVAGASGTSGTASSGAMTTTNALDLVFGANMTSGCTNGPGTSFTSRVITQPNCDAVEDRKVTTVGSYAATMSVSAGSPWVMQMVVFRGAPSDSQPPTPPSSLNATATSSSQVSLSWGASSDNLGVASYFIERCTGSGCSSFSQIGTAPATATSFVDGGLTPNTAYGYRVRASDGSGNFSAYSNVATTTTLPDSTPPTAPATLGASAVSSTRIDLSWAAATDNVGVTGYLIERCQGSGCSSFAQIAAPLGTGTTYSDTTAVAGTTYGYRVRATDLAGNLGPYSPVASATTPTPDVMPPTAPSGLQATAATNVQINLSWTAANDNVAVTGYLIERCQGSGCSSFAQVAAPPGTGTTYVDAGLQPSTSYSYRVRATDGSGNIGPYAGVASATTLATAPPPVVPKFIQATYATPQGSRSSVPVTFTGAQRIGNFNAVIVGWADASASVTSVTDSKGNVYQRAIGPTRNTGGALSQSIYYATNIAGAAAGTNTVTVAFSPAAFYPDVRILEYSGVAITTPLDAANGSTGSGTSSNSGALTTTASGDLIVAGNTVSSLSSAAGSGYTLRFITQPNGNIAEDRVAGAAGSYTATAALQSSDWVMQAAAFKAAPPDGTPPLVTVTSPAPGGTFTGNVTVNVTASDPDSGVLAIQLTVDGAVVGLLQPTSPTTFTLNTATFPNGPHAIGAQALNGQRVTGYAPGVNATFNNASPGNPAATGLWSGLISLPIVVVHTSQLPDGRILMSEGQSLGDDARTWDTNTNAFGTVPVPANIFCSGHEQMADGRIFVGGGHNAGAHLGLRAGTVFDPTTDSWTVLPLMTSPRWYPTTTTLSDGRVLILGGETNCPYCEATIPEIYNPQTNAWTRLTTANLSFTYYPHAFTLPNGKVLLAGTGESPTPSYVLDLTTNTWTALGTPARDTGSSVMFKPGVILTAGKSVDPDDIVVPSVATTYVLDMNQASPAWRTVASMRFARTYLTLTVLPDGSVVATGGGPTTAPLDTANAIRPAELWDPTTETWTTMASMNAPRLYHSEALLMPDGRVVVMGGGRFDDNHVPQDQYNGEFFSPPYLFKGPRPIIGSAPTTIAFGSVFNIGTPDAARIAKVSLIRFGSTTHAINMSQRFVPLSFTAGAGSLSVTAPANSKVATPGNYMLFLVDTSGVPSIAAQVRL